MKKLFTILILALSTNVFAQQTHIPDQNFEQALIDLGLDDTLDTQVLTANIQTVTSLDISSKNISDFTGIEDFILLDSLLCYNNRYGYPSTLDVSQNVALTFLNCSNSGINSLIINNNLQRLYCSYNNLQTIDLSGASSLVHLSCDHNNLTSLDVSQNTQLIQLRCWYNNLSTLDVSQNVMLEYLDADYNNLTTLDVSNNPNLSALWCDHNQLTELNVANGNNINFDFEPFLPDYNSSYFNTYPTGFCAISNPNLSCITVDDASWATINWNEWNNSINSGMFFSNDCSSLIYGCTDTLASNYNPNANILDNSCLMPGKTFIPDSTFENYLEYEGLGDGILNNDSVLTQSIRYVKEISLGYRYSATGLSIQDYSGIEEFRHLESLTIRNNDSISGINNLNLATNLHLKELYFIGPAFTLMPNLPQNNILKFNVAGTRITNLNISQLLQAFEINIYNNHLLSNIIFSNNQNVQHLDIRYNHQLQSLFVPQLNNLLDLEVDNCYQLSSLSFGGGASLREISCYNNNLSFVDVSHITQLKELKCNGNQLTNISLNQLIEVLYCQDNLLTSLQLGSCSNLETLNFDNNQLSNVDLSGNVNIERAYGRNNNLTSVNLKNTGGSFVNNSSSGIPYQPLFWFSFIGNQNLYCIDVDNKSLADSIWNQTNRKSYYTQYSEDCSLEVYGCQNSSDPNYDSTATINYGCTNDSMIYIPDDNFEQALIDNGYDNVLDDSLSYSAALNVFYLSISYRNITDLTGIEAFANLTTLTCSNNQLSTLDVSSNTALTYLNCYSNQLSTLDVSSNISLTTLYCYSNQLSTLDVSSNTALIYLNCSDNQLSTLDVSSNTALTSLRCHDNQLSTLDVTSNTALTYLDCSDNQLSTLDVSSNTALTYLNCYSNQLSTLDVSSNTALTTLNCFNNQLSTLDVSSNTALTTLYCYSNQLSTLDVSRHGVLTTLNCSNNQLSTLDVSLIFGNSVLTTLDCYSNQLSTLDVSSNTALINLNCSNNQLSTLDVSSNTALTDLTCFSNQLSTLDVSSNTALTILWCHNNQLSTLDVSSNIALTNLWCQNNQLSTLDVRNGNNINMNVYTTNNPNLFCVDVDNVPNAQINWLFDSHTVFSTDCSTANGCTDLLACNYNPQALLDDSTCTYITNETTTVSECDSYTWSANGQTYYSSGQYIYTSPTTTGCDTIKTLNLTINNSTSSHSSINACNNYIWSVTGDTIFTNGTYINVSNNTFNCTHVDSLELTISTTNNTTTNIDTSTCEGFSLNGVYYSITSTFVQLYPVNQCDTNFVVLDLEIIGNTTQSYDTIATQNSVLWNDQLLTESGDYVYSTLNTQGCDSLVNLNLTILAITSVQEMTTKKDILKVTDLLGREMPIRKNTPLLFIYKDGTAERKIIYK